VASKRMFDKSIIDTDRFTDMPMSTKALYFLLGMEADDFGFVSPKRIMRMHGGTEDDVKILVAKNFVIPFDSGVYVITEWNKHNWLDKRHIKPTEYQEELKMLRLVDKKYHIGSVVELLESSTELLEDSKNSLRETLDDTENPLGQISRDKISLDKSSTVTTSAEPLAKASTRRKNSEKNVKTKPDQGAEPAVITLLLNDKTEHPVFQSQIDKWVELYPAVDVMQELRGMVGWIDANPQKRKTKSGISKFINSWLAKAQNQGGRGYAGPPPGNGAKGGDNAANGTGYQIGGDDDPYKNITS